MRTFHGTYCTLHTGMGVTKPISSVPLISPFFRIIKTLVTCWYITFIFDRCRHSLAVVKSVKYECDSRTLTGTFTGLSISPTEKLTSFSTPHPWSARIDDLNKSNTSRHGGIITLLLQLRIMGCELKIVWRAGCHLGIWQVATHGVMATRGRHEVCISWDICLGY